MYGVFENGKPCSEVGFPAIKGLGWTTHEFETYDLAFAYAKLWLGAYSDAIEEDFGIGKKVNFNGYGDTIEILNIGGLIPETVETFTCTWCGEKWPNKGTEFWSYCPFCGAFI
jgi:hypothetical protein